MAAKLSETDRRGAALLARYGHATVVRFKGYWLCGGHRVAQVTIRRLLKTGYARRGEERPDSEVFSTASTAAAGPVGYLPPDAQRELSGYWPEAKTVRAEAEDAETWAPPEYTDALGRPLAVDEAFNEEEDER